ncbi:SDR family oxidoreductase [Rhodococcus qingshengii]|uniref:SDR family oxidoreductase n=1 Tax=Rhodococcus qingshengii TaxID=334542 RepID=UPI0030D4362F
MSGRLVGRTALIVGEASGILCAQALRFAEEGADLVVVDWRTGIAPSILPGAGDATLGETVQQVEEMRRQIIVVEANPRSQGSLDAAVTRGVEALTQFDMVCVTGGLTTAGKTMELPMEDWQEMLDLHLSAVWKTTKASIPHIIESGRGGSLVLTNCGMPGLGHVAVANHGLVGLMRSLAKELSPHRIRINTVHAENLGAYSIPSRDPQGTRLLGQRDVANACLFLSSDESRYISGVTLSIDAGCEAK